MSSESPQVLALDDLRRGVLSLNFSSVDIANAVGLHRGMNTHVPYPLMSDVCYDTITIYKQYNFMSNNY